MYSNQLNYKNICITIIVPEASFLIITSIFFCRLINRIEDNSYEISMTNAAKVTLIFLHWSLMLSFIDPFVTLCDFFINLSF